VSPTDSAQTHQLNFRLSLIGNAGYMFVHLPAVHRWEEKNNTAVTFVCLQIPVLVLGVLCAATGVGVTKGVRTPFLQHFHCAVSRSLSGWQEGEVGSKERCSLTKNCFLGMACTLDHLVLRCLVF
jgi:hypothetical protein